MIEHDDVFENLGAYAIGALNGPDAAAVRRHLDACGECRREYRELSPAVTLLATSAESCADAASGAIAAPSALLKARLMRQVRADAPAQAPAAVGMRRMRPVVWPAYAVAAACLAIALISSVYNIGLSQRIGQADAQIAALTSHANALASSSETQKQMVADLMAPDSQRFAVNGGEVVKNEGRAYVAMHSAPMPPKGKVYQAWYLRAGSKTMTPSLTFVPDRTGVAVVAIPGNAKVMEAVAVSIEPEGGSKQPTSKPAFVVKFT